MIGEDTVKVARTLLSDRKGVKIKGSGKFLPDSQIFVRVKMLVEKKYKSTLNLPDTVFVLKEVDNECGIRFLPYYGDNPLFQAIQEFIIYGDKWVETSVVYRQKKKHKKIKELKETLIPDYFYIDFCSRTNNVTEKETAELEKISYPK